MGKVHNVRFFNGSWCILNIPMNKFFDIFIWGFFIGYVCGFFAMVMIYYIIGRGGNL